MMSRLSNKQIGLILFVIAIILFGSVNVEGERFENIEPNSSFYVYDEAGLMTEDLKDYIIKTNEKLYNEVGAQVVVVTLTTLENRDIREYATSLFESWEIGTSGEDNGMLILIAPNEDKLWIESGYGLEGALPDSIIKRIIEDEILPYFKQGDFENGILSGFNRIISGIEVEYGIDLGEIKEVSEDIKESRRDDYWMTIILILLVLFIDMRFFKGMILNTLIRSIGYGRNNYYKGSGGNNRSSGGGGRSGGGGAGGSW